MIDVDDSAIILEIDRQARNLSALPDDRIARETEAIRRRAIAQFIASGDDELTAWFGADDLIQRLRALIANHRRMQAHTQGRPENI